MSWMLDLLLSLLMAFNRLKYFWAWLATCVGVLEITKFREMLLQSPLPNLSRPNRNNLAQSWICKNHKNPIELKQQHRKQ
eukprot:c18396_g1_i3 orf=20-259(-)